jgi:glycogen synthase
MVLKIMRILVITDLYPPYANGGYEIRCKETVDEMNRRGHEVFVLTSKWGIAKSQVGSVVRRLLFYNALKDLKNISFRWLDVLPLKTRLFFKDVLFNFCARCYQVKWIFNRRKNYRIAHGLMTITQPDLVFVWNMGYIGVEPILAAQDLNIPTVFSIGDYWLLNLKNELCGDFGFLKKKFRAAITGLKDFSQLDLRHLLSISTVIKNTYIDNGFPQENLNVISRGVQSNLILSASALGQLPRNRNGKMKLLFAGRIVLDKAPDVAIKALDILRMEHGIEDIELDIVGQGSREYITSLEHLVFELKLEKNIKFLSWIDHSAMLRFYSDFDALLFPSRWVEPLGGAILEAMAQGLPVIASRRGGPLEIIDDGVNGLLVPVDDPVALAEAILRLLQSEDFTQKIRAAGIKTINERYTLEHVVDQNLEYFQTILVSKDKKFL